MLRPYNVGDGDRGTVLASQGAQVQHAALWRPQECVGDGLAPPVRSSGLAHPHDAAAVVHVVGAAGASAEGPQVDHAALFGPQKCVTASAHNLASVVDPERDADGAPERVEILHPARRRPQEGVCLASARLRQADDFATVVHAVRDARRPTQAPEVEHPARLWYEEGMLCGLPWDATVPGDLPLAIDGDRFAFVSAERAEIEARPLRQEVGVKNAEPGVAAAHDLAGVVDVVGRCVYARERLQVDDPQLRLPEERPRPPQTILARAHDLARPVHGLRLAHDAAQGAELVDRD